MRGEAPVGASPLILFIDDSLDMLTLKNISASKKLKGITPVIFSLVTMENIATLVRPCLKRSDMLFASPHERIDYA
jgi:hypothetical protein